MRPGRARKPSSEAERHGCLAPGEADRNCRARRVPLGSPVESGGPGRYRGACFRAWLTGIREVRGCGQFVQNTKRPGLVVVKGARIYRVSVHRALAS